MKKPKEPTIQDFKQNQAEYERLNKVYELLEYCYDELLGFGHATNKQSIDLDMEVGDKTGPATDLIQVIQEEISNRLHRLEKDNRVIAKRL